MGKLAFSFSEAQKRSSHSHHRLLFPLKRNRRFKFQSKLFELLFEPVIRNCYVLCAIAWCCSMFNIHVHFILKSERTNRDEWTNRLQQFKFHKLFRDILKDISIFDFSLLRFDLIRSLSFNHFPSLSTSVNRWYCQYWSFFFVLVFW